MTTPPFLTSAILNGAARHGFFSREGGVSTGDYASLNTGPGSNDDPEKIRENRNRCAEALGVDTGRLVTGYQIHSADVHIISAPWEDGPRRGDALVTNTPGLAIGVLTADCMPWLFADAHAGVIAAAHAGWRGALAGVLENTVAAMEALGAAPERICAALGPCLRQENFEVGPDLVEAFTAKYPDAEMFFSPGRKPGKFQFDLSEFAIGRLGAAGISTFEDVGLCTMALSDRYFSYRASQRRGDADYGRNLSAITLE